MSAPSPFTITNMDNDTIVVISGQAVTLAEAQKFVDGYVQLITLGDGSQALMNEDSRGRDGNRLLPNKAATAMLKPEGVAMSSTGIRGNVLILKNGYRWT